MSEPASGITVTLPADLDPHVRDEVLDALGHAGATVAAPDDTFDLAGWQEAYAAGLDRILAESRDVPSILAAYWKNLGGLGGFLRVVACLVLGLVAWAIVLRSAPAPMAPSTTDMPRFRSRLSLGSWGFLRDLAAIAAFLAVSFAVGYALLPDEPSAARQTVSGFANELMVLLFFVGLTRLILNPTNRAARLAPLNDADARHVWRTVLIVIVLPIPFTLYRLLIIETADQPEQASLTVIAVESLITVTRIYLFWSVRKPICVLIRRAFGSGDATAPLVSAFARYWHIAYSLFAIVRLGTVITDELNGVGAGPAITLSFALVVLLPFIIGGVGAWFDDRAVHADGKAPGTTMSDTAKALLQGTIAVGGAVIVLRSWGIDPFVGNDGSPEDLIAAALLKASGAVVIGWALWRGVQSMLDQYSPASGAAELSDEGMGKTGSRIDTLIPIFRSAAFVVIVVVSGLTALTALGVHIGPLLAGAGVIGLAVGFGAQTLVKDVITGVFYLLEDAFRVGEYVVTDAGKGVVEKISLRSVRLRHHRGPVYTIPFGSMGTIQNHSRDWVKVKLIIRVPFTADIEKVRKLIKRVGLEMLDEPEIAENIIAPVKSQGVLEVDDSAMVIGVKFICKPGEQFVVRREAYARIQKAFAENDIEFAPKRVIVESDSEEFQRSRAGAAAAAAAHAADAGMDAAS